MGDKACLFPPDYFSSQWLQISEGLRKVAESRDAAALRSHLQTISSDSNFHAARDGRPDFEAVLDYIPESQHFFSGILPKIVGLAEQAPAKFRSKDVPVLVPGVSGVVILAHSEVAVLLALAFLGLLPNGVSMSPLYFPKDGCAFPPNTEKLRCFLNYFDHVSEVFDSERGIQITRVIGDTWGSDALEGNSCPLCEVMVRDLHQPIYDSRYSSLHVDFANARVGGGIFLNAPGSTAQEEITFATHPELSAATLLCPSLENNEALLIQGARRFCRHVGFLDTFSFLEGINQSDPDFFNDAIQIVIDARMYDSGGIGRPYRYDHKLLAELATFDVALCCYQIFVARWVVDELGRCGAKCSFFSFCLALRLEPPNLANKSKPIILLDQ